MDFYDISRILDNAILIIPRIQKVQMDGYALLDTMRFFEIRYFFSMLFLPESTLTEMSVRLDTIDLCLTDINSTLASIQNLKSILNLRVTTIGSTLLSILNDDENNINILKDELNSVKTRMVRFIENEVKG